MYNSAVRDCAERTAVALGADWLLPDAAGIITIEMRPRDDAQQPQRLLPPDSADTDFAAATTLIPPHPDESHGVGDSGTGGPGQTSPFSAAAIGKGLLNGLRHVKTEALRQQARPAQPAGVFRWLKRNGASVKMALPRGVH